MNCELCGKELDVFDIAEGLGICESCECDMDDVANDYFDKLMDYPE